MYVYVATREEALPMCVEEMGAVMVSSELRVVCAEVMEMVAVYGDMESEQYKPSIVSGSFYGESPSVENLVKAVEKMQHVIVRLERVSDEIVTQDRSVMIEMHEV